MNFIKLKKELEKIEKVHYAALKFSTIYIPGDERSQTNPGHGYPAENKPIVEYIAFKDETEMKEWVIRQEMPRFGSPNKNYTILRSEVLDIKINPVVVMPLIYR